MSTGTEKPRTQESEHLQLDDLGYLLMKRPFSLDRITEPGVGDVDVPGIHAGPFDTLTRTAREALQAGCGIGVVLNGDAGIGKSHVLARLADWAKREGPCCILLQNLNACASQLVESIRKSVVSQLTGGRRSNFAHTRLYQMAVRAIECQREPGETSARFPFERFVETATARHPGDAHQDEKIYLTLWRFLVSSYKMLHQGIDDGVARLAVRWLSDDRLEAEELAALGLHEAPASEESPVVDDYATTRLLVSLGEIARAAGQPFILCLDQVEVLDQEQIHRLSRFMHVLLDRSKNLLLITASVQETLLQFVQCGAISEAAWNRIRQRPPAVLPTIDKDQARKLLEVRLERFGEAVRGVPELWNEIQHDSLFPLGRAWFDEHIGTILEIRPRRVVTLARERWQQQEQRLARLGVTAWLARWAECDDVPQPPFSLEAAIDEKVARRLDEQAARRKVDQATLPPDAANFAGLTEQLLSCCHGAEGAKVDAIERPEPQAGRRPTYDRIVRLTAAGSSKPLRTGLLFVTTEDAKSTAYYLRRVREDADHPDRVLLVTDARRPLKLGDAGRQYLTWLQAQGWFATLDLDLDDVVMLDALQAVLAQAKAGDIEIDLPGGATHRVTPEEVAAAYERHGRFPAHRLLKSLLDATAVPTNRTADKWDAGTLPAFINAQLALTMGMSTVGLAQKYLQMHSLPADDFPVLHERMKEEATRMHAAGLVSAKPTEDGLFLLLK